MRNESEIPDKELRSSQLSQPQPPYNVQPQHLKFNFQPAGCNLMVQASVQPSDQKNDQSSSKLHKSPNPHTQSTNSSNKLANGHGHWAIAIRNVLSGDRILES